MQSKLLKFITIILVTIFGLSLVCSTNATYAANDVCGTNAPIKVRQAAGCPETGGNTDAVKTVITSILNGIIAVSGLIAVIFVVVGGINYITSSGDAAKVEKAKKTILYACIGIIITVLSFALVNFVIINLIGGGNSSQTDGDSRDPSSYTSSSACESAGHNWDSNTKRCEN